MNRNYYLRNDVRLLIMILENESYFDKIVGVDSFEYLKLNFLLYFLGIETCLVAHFLLSTVMPQ
jgi:hypothetical protein